MRLFFGLSLPDDVRAITAECALRTSAAIPGRYTSADNHHITLAFLGDVAHERLKDACCVLSQCLQAFPAPTITLDALSYFGRAQNGILIIRAQSAPSLDGLHMQLVHALHACGLPADPGPFSPHVTLARHALIPQQLPSFEPVSFTARQAHVFLSARDERNILRYTPLYSVPFLN